MMKRPMDPPVKPKGDEEKKGLDYPDKPGNDTERIKLMPHSEAGA